MMKHYKRLLLKKFSENGWELVSQDSNTDWWLEEVWTIQSVRQKWGLELLILFLVDPLYDGPDKSQAVWEISATTELSKDRTEASDGLAFMSIIGDFDQLANDFLVVINGYRDSTS